MRSETNPILLEGPIDYLIFSSGKINLQHESELSISGEIIDHDKNGVQIRVLESLSDNILKNLGSGETLRLSAPYKSMQLRFDVNISDLDQNHNILTVKVPSHGVLSEKRNETRRNFTKTSELQAELKIDSPTQIITCRSNRLVDFSSSTISLLVDRGQGLALPADVVSSINIFSNNKLVFESGGVVQRIDMNYSDSGNPDEYLMVITLEEKSTMGVVGLADNRRSDRTILISEKSSFIQFCHPFLEHTPLTFRIADLSNSGLSIIMDESMKSIPNGLLVYDASIQLPLKSRLQVSFKVTSVQEIEIKDDGQLYVQRVGLQLLDLTPDALKEITNFVQRDKSEYLIDANDDDYQKLWEFYFETGFIYGSKRKQIQNYAKEVFHTYRKLLTSNTPLLKKILFKQDGEIKGHVNAVKIFDHTLIVQHLNALKASGASAAQAVIGGMTSFLLDYQANKTVSNRYMCSYYRPDNLYPSLVFGETANLINNEAICWTRVYDFCLPNRQKVEISTEVTCSEASAEDLKKLEMLLVEQNEHPLMRVESLTRESFVNLKVTGEYDKIGLYRYRKVFVAHNEDSGATGYAVCTYTSPGINFSELTNSVKFFYSYTSAQENQKLADSLGVAILNSYRDTAMPNPVLLLTQGQALPIGFSREKSYILWVMDINYSIKFREASEIIFSDLKRYIRLFKDTMKHANAG